MLNKIKSSFGGRKSKIIFLFLFAISAFSARIVFAGDPIPGVGVGLGKSPGGIMAKTTTDVDGRFSFNFKEGKYDLIISYDEIIKAISFIDKNKTEIEHSYEITLILDGGNEGVLVNDNKPPAKILFDKRTGIIVISIPKGGGAIKGTLNYESKVSPNSIVLNDTGNVNTGGTITIIKPVNGAEIDIISTQTINFVWKSTGLKGPFSLKIVEIKGEQSPDIALKENKPVYQKEGIMSDSIKVSFSSYGINQQGVKIAYQVSCGDIVSPYAFINTSRSNIKR